MLEVDDVVMVSARGDASSGNDIEMPGHGGERGAASTGCEVRGDTIDSRAIFGARKEVTIRHGDQLYRLRITRHGRLILNK